jgi:hypothetical protein
VRESLDRHPPCDVPDAEFRRLLGFPRGHGVDGRAAELAAWARAWYAEHGRPWVYVREAALEATDTALRIDGVEFRSASLRRHLRSAAARRVALVAVSAGRGCEEHARRLWEEAKPDEYFFLESFGSAVVEHLVAATSGRLCAQADRDGLMAVPHYSPGYAGWEVADQNRLFGLITRGMTRPFPEALEVLPSGMLKPKKALLAVFGLTARTAEALAAASLVPCERCSFSPCQFRRAPHRPAAARGETPAAGPGPAGGAAGAAPAPAAPYRTNPRALRKWAGERVRLAPRADGAVEARFRFDGTTCSNLGQPLAFDYVVLLGAPETGGAILEAACRPAPGDVGHTKMCAWLNDAAALERALAVEKPLLGRPLAEVLTWTRPAAPSGCFCNAESRLHNWGVALEAIHFALAQTAARPRALEPLSSPP